MREHQKYAQMALAHRYLEGQGGLNQKCQAAFLYYEPAAHLTAKYVMESHGLDVVEMRKLKFSPYMLDSKLQIDEKTQIRVGKAASDADIEELMEFQGEYGHAESLELKGTRFMHAAQKSKDTYQKAYAYFEKALSLDKDSKPSIYYLGLMNLLGLGRPQDI